ncbi:MAG: YcxB family protein [Chitinophagales bacterium]
MTITYKYTPHLLQQAHELHYRKFFPLRGKIILILGLLSAWAGLLLLLIKGGGKNLWYSVPLIIYGIVAIILHFYISRTVGKRAFKKLKQYHEPFSISADDDGLIIEIKNKQYEVPWNGLKKALMTDDLILLYPNDAVFFIFPRVNFSANGFDEFRNKVKENIEKVF